MIGGPSGSVYSPAGTPLRVSLVGSPGFCVGENIGLDVRVVLWIARPGREGRLGMTRFTGLASALAAARLSCVEIPFTVRSVGIFDAPAPAICTMVFMLLA